MKFKDRLVQLRKELNLTQTDFAEKIGFSRTAISAWEIGRNEPSNEDTIKIADFFGVSVDYIIGNSDIRNPEELKNIQFANHGGLNTEGLGEEELKELQRQIDFIKKMKEKKNK